MIKFINTNEHKTKWLAELNRSLELICKDDPTPWSRIDTCIADPGGEISQHDLAKTCIINEITKVIDQDYKPKQHEHHHTDRPKDSGC